MCYDLFWWQNSEVILTFRQDYKVNYLNLCSDLRCFGICKNIYIMIVTVELRHFEQYEIDKSMYKIS